ncbi:helix-turn-helix domain-containing protein [Streptomycetaceae bacterium NBC_01309]
MHHGSDAPPSVLPRVTADVLPAEVLWSAAIRAAGARRDIGEIFRIAHREAGLSISRLARLCDMTPSRVGAYARGTSQVRDQRVIERVADGLRIPGEILGLRSRPWEHASRPSARRLRPGAAPESAGLLPEPAPESSSFPAPSLLAEVSTGVELEFGSDGRTRVTYRHNVVNTTDRSIDRLTRRLAFPEATGMLTIVPLPGSVHGFTVEDLYDAGTFATFTCRMTTPIRPGDVAVIAYRCSTMRYVRSGGKWQRERPVAVRAATRNL